MSKWQDPLARFDGKPWKSYAGVARNELPLQKPSDPVYNVAVAGRLTGVSGGRLKRWEAWSLINPAHDTLGRRFYSDNDLAQIERIKRYLDAGGVNLAAISTIIALEDALTALGDDMDNLPL